MCAGNRLMEHEIVHNQHVIRSYLIMGQLLQAGQVLPLRVPEQRQHGTIRDRPQRCGPCLCPMQEQRGQQHQLHYVGNEVARPGIN